MRNLKKLREEQLKLAKKFNPHEKIKFEDVKFVAGVDSAFFSKNGKEYCVCIITVFDFNKLELVEERHSITKVKFPYIPTFLSYRELPGFKAALKKLKTKPDVFLFDANGILHPFKIGFATHAAIVSGIVSIGVAKSLLCGTMKRDHVYLNNEKVAFVIKRKNFKPLFISQGNNISLKTAIKIVKKCFKDEKARLPEPIRMADAISKRQACKSNL